MYITWFCYIWRVVVLSFIPSTPKLVNFLLFFGFQELRTNRYIYNICIYVHMYITWFCYIWRVVVLSFSPPTPKLVIFPIFWIPGVEKTHVNTKTSQFSPFFWFQELRKKHVNTKASQFSTFFGFQELRKKLERGNTKGRWARKEPKKKERREGKEKKHEVESDKSDAAIFSLTI